MADQDTDGAIAPACFDQSAGVKSGSRNTRIRYRGAKKTVANLATLGQPVFELERTLESFSEASTENQKQDRAYHVYNRWHVPFLLRHALLDSRRLHFPMRPLNPDPRWSRGGCTGGSRLMVVFGVDEIGIDREELSQMRWDCLVMKLLPRRKDFLTYQKILCLHY